MQKNKPGIFERDARFNPWLFAVLVGVSLLAAVLIPLFSNWRQARLEARCHAAGGQFDAMYGRCTMPTATEKP